MGIGLSERGWRLLLSSFTILLIALLFRDLMLGFVGFSCVCLMGYSYYSLSRVVSNLGRFVKINPESFEETLTAGQIWTGKLKISSKFNGVMTLVSPVEGGSLNPKLFESGEESVIFTFKPQLSGEYTADNIDLIAQDRLGLWSSVARTPFLVRFRVYSRLFEVVIAVLEYMGEGRRVGVAAQSSMLGSGLEYADSRDYVPGDSPRIFDWKATARLGRPIVKDFYIEGEMGLHIVLEASAPDPVSRDELSAEYLRTVLSFAQQGIPMGLTVGGNSGIVFTAESLAPQMAVAEALRTSLKFADVNAETLYEVLDPSISSLLRRILSKGVLSQSRGGLAESFSRIETHLELVVVTALMDPLGVSELTRISRFKGWGMVVLQPTRPWDYCFGLEESVEVYRRYLKLSRMMGKLVPIVLSADEVQGSIAERTPYNKFAR